MTKFGKTTNQSALDFNRNAVSIMQQISQPLLNSGITIFTYCRFFQDGKRLYLSTNLKWTKLYIEKGFYNVLDHLEMYYPPDDIEYSLWSSLNHDQVFDALYGVDIWNGFSIYEKSLNYSDSFDFASCKENIQISNFYINNIPFLKDFIKTFKEKAADLINPLDEDKFIFPHHPVSVYDLQYSSFMGEDKIKNFREQLSL